MEPVPTTNSTPNERTKMTGRKKAGLWLMIAPIALIVVSFLLFGIGNSVFSTLELQSRAPQSLCPELDYSQSGASGVQPPTFIQPCTLSDIFGPNSDFRETFNFVLQLTGLAGAVALIPGLIAGILLLRSSRKQQNLADKSHTI